MKFAYTDHLPAAEAAIRATGERLTQPRLAVLACLQACDRAATHLEIAGWLQGQHAVDRVTVYRVLEWLVTQRIAHRIAGDDRVWRFMISPVKAPAGTGKPARKGQPEHGQHAHFTCESCGKTFCLDEQPRVAMKLPKGFRSSEIDLTVRGQCAHC